MEHSIDAAVPFTGEREIRRTGDQKVFLGKKTKRSPFLLISRSPVKRDRLLT
jgi:hypothetical protein